VHFANSEGGHGWSLHAVTVLPSLAPLFSITGSETPPKEAQWAAHL